MPVRSHRGAAQSSAIKTYVGEVIQSASEPTASSFEKWVQESLRCPKLRKRTGSGFRTEDSQCVFSRTPDPQRVQSEKTTLREAWRSPPGKPAGKIRCIAAQFAREGFVSFSGPGQRKIAVVKEEQVSRKSRYFVQDSSRLVNL